MKIYFEANSNAIRLKQRYMYLVKNKKLVLRPQYMIFVCTPTMVFAAKMQTDKVLSWFSELLYSFTTQSNQIKMHRCYLLFYTPYVWYDKVFQATFLLSIKHIISTIREYMSWCTIYVFIFGLWTYCHNFKCSYWRVWIVLSPIPSYS